MFGRLADGAHGVQTCWDYVFVQGASQEIAKHTLVASFGDVTPPPPRFEPASQFVKWFLRLTAPIVLWGGAVGLWFAHPLG